MNKYRSLRVLIGHPLPPSQISTSLHTLPVISISGASSRSRSMAAALPGIPQVPTLEQEARQQRYEATVTVIRNNLQDVCGQLSTPGYRSPQSKLSIVSNKDSK